MEQEIEKDNDALIQTRELSRESKKFKLLLKKKLDLNAIFNRLRIDADNIILMLENQKAINLPLETFNEMIFDLTKNKRFTNQHKDFILNMSDPEEIKIVQHFSSYKIPEYQN